MSNTISSMIAAAILLLATVFATLACVHSPHGYVWMLCGFVYLTVFFRLTKLIEPI